MPNVFIFSLLFCAAHLLEEPLNPDCSFAWKSAARIFSQQGWKCHSGDMREGIVFDISRRCDWAERGFSSGLCVERKCYCVRCVHFYNSSALFYMWICAWPTSLRHKSSLCAYEREAAPALSVSDLITLGKLARIICRLNNLQQAKEALKSRHYILRAFSDVFFSQIN